MTKIMIQKHLCSECNANIVSLYKTGKQEVEVFIDCPICSTLMDIDNETECYMVENLNGVKDWL